MDLLPQIESYIKSVRPLGIQNAHITKLGAGEYNINYLIEIPDRKFVFRISVNQLSGVKDQLKHEYDVLTYLKGQDIAPQAHYLDMDGFLYPILIEEFIEGDPVSTLDEGTLTKIGHAIGMINKVRIAKPHPFEVRYIDYDRDIADQKRILNSIAVSDDNHILLETAHRFAAQIRIKLGKTKPEVQTMLIRRDANPTNFILTSTGIRMIDWEITRIDDPTITVASFINEVFVYDLLNVRPLEADMEIVKKSFSTTCAIPNFEELLHNRLQIEQLGGLVWGLERIDSLSKKSKPDDFDTKMGWYNKVVLNSIKALDMAF